jgi:hypothetical protein
VLCFRFEIVPLNLGFVSIVCDPAFLFKVFLCVNFQSFCFILFLYQNLIMAIAVRRLVAIEKNEVVSIFFGFNTFSNKAQYEGVRQKPSN